MVRDWLGAQAVSETHFGEPVLYAWLAADEVAAVVGGESVTTISSEDDAFDAALAADTSEVAARLREPARSGRRRAWPSAWAMRRGGGEHLARVELRPESLVLVYDARTTPPTIHFSTDRGVAAPFDEALHVPDFWAAVLFVHACSAAPDTPPCREFVLVSASMIARVSMGSPEIANELRIEHERLLRLARDLPETATEPSATELDRAWAALPPDDASMTTAYASALASGHDYALARTPLVTLAATLVDRTEPFEWRTSIPSEPRPQFFE